LCALLSACAGSAPRSVSSLPAPEREALEKMRSHTVAESRKLMAEQEALQRELRKEAAAQPIKTLAPRFDPLEARSISLALSGASINEVLMVFADQAKLNLIVDPLALKDERRADMHLKNVSLREAFEEMLRTFDVVGEIKGRTLRVSLNEERVFSLDFLNTTGRLDLSTGGNVFGATAGGSGGGSSGNAGSNPISGNLMLSGGGGLRNDPYSEIEASLKSILGDFAAQAATTSASRQDDREARDMAGSFSLNKMTGTLYVKARPSKIRAVEKMLARVKETVNRQVYIEAQLIDVQLSDQFEFGVDWSLLRSYVAAGFGANPITLAAAGSTLPNPGASVPSRSLTIPASVIGSAGGRAAGIAYQTHTFGAVINALRSFGALKVLSNPNVQVRNGTPALLSVGSSVRYISRSSSTQTTPGGGATTTTSDVQTDSLFSGVMVGVLPYLRDDGRIELLIYPMQSDVDQKSLQLVEVTPTNRVTLPVVNYKGVSTTLNVGDGDVVVIGGLIDQRFSNGDRGAPGLSDVPVLGKLFGSENTNHASRELVIVLRVRVV
jgi:general secretion pathway protein D